MNVKTILVPLDGSPIAEAALAPAVEVAREKNATLVLLRATEAHTLFRDAVEAQTAAVREAEDYLDGVRDRLMRDGLANVQVSAWYGLPAEAIIEAARYRNADLIVMSSHGRSGLGRLVLGSVAEMVLRGTRVPILLIRPGDAPLEPPYIAGRTTEEVGHV